MLLLDINSCKELNPRVMPWHWQTWTGSNRLMPPVLVTENSCHDANFVITGSIKGYYDSWKSSWCQLCHHWWHHRFSFMTTKSDNHANFVITDGTAGCHHDNLRCHQWWQSWHHNISLFSVVQYLPYLASLLRWHVWYLHSLHSYNQMIHPLKLSRVGRVAKCL